MGGRIFQLADGSVTPSCAVAGVAYVDVFMNDAPVQRYDCDDGGATITDVDAASYLLTVEGVDERPDPAPRRAAGRRRPLRRSAGPVPAFRGVRRAELRVREHGTCITPGPSYLWFSIFDQVANATTVQIDQASPLGDQSSTRAATCAASCSRCRPARTTSTGSRSGSRRRSTSPGRTAAGPPSPLSPASRPGLVGARRHHRGLSVRTVIARARPRPRGRGRGRSPRRARGRPSE